MQQFRLLWCGDTFNYFTLVHLGLNDIEIDCITSLNNKLRCTE